MSRRFLFSFFYSRFNDIFKQSRLSFNELAFISVPFLFFSLPAISDNLLPYHLTLSAIHRNLLDGKINLALDQISTGYNFYNHDPVIVEALNEYLNLAFKKSNNNLLPEKLDWPDKIYNFKIQIRKSSGTMGDHHSIVITGETVDNNIRNIEFKKIIKNFHYRLLSLASGDKWDIQKTNDSQWRFNLSTGSSKNIIIPGLYEVTITLMTGQTGTSRILIGEEYTTDHIPQILRPLKNEVLNQKDLKFVWKDFFSKNYKNFEERHFVNILFDSFGKISWLYFSPPLPQNPLSASNEIFIDPFNVQPQIGVNKFNPGYYHLYVMYSEDRKIGPVTLSRQIDNSVNFTIK